MYDLNEFIMNQHLAATNALEIWNEMRWLQNTALMFVFMIANAHMRHAWVWLGYAIQCNGVQGSIKG